jgi:hypothetical protein
MAVMPAQAGNRKFVLEISSCSPWIPAFAGMTPLLSVPQI